MAEQDFLTGTAAGDAKGNASGAVQPDDYGQSSAGERARMAKVGFPLTASTQDSSELPGRGGDVGEDVRATW